jgi:hypothetical protein
LAVNISPCLPGQSLRRRNIDSWPYSSWIQAAKLPVLTVTGLGLQSHAFNSHWSAIL